MSPAGPLARQLRSLFTAHGMGTQRLHLTLAPSWPAQVSGARGRGVCVLRQRQAAASLLASNVHTVYEEKSVPGTQHHAALSVVGSDFSCWSLSVFACQSAVVIEMGLSFWGLHPPPPPQEAGHGVRSQWTPGREAPNHCVCRGGPERTVTQSPPSDGVQRAFATVSGSRLVTPARGWAGRPCSG